MMDFIIQFVSSTLGILIVGLLFWRWIKRNICEEVKSSFSEKDTHDRFKRGDIVEVLRPCYVDTSLGIYIGRDELDRHYYISENGNILDASRAYMTKLTREYDIKINFEKILTEEEKIKTRIDALEKSKRKKQKKRI